MHGTSGLWVRGNAEAAGLWVKSLKSLSDAEHNWFLVHLNLQILQVTPLHRPEAPVIVSDILDFKAP